MPVTTLKVATLMINRQAAPGAHFAPMLNARERE